MNCVRNFLPNESEVFAREVRYWNRAFCKHVTWQYSSLCAHAFCELFYTWSGTTEMVNKKKKAVSSLKLKIPLLLLKSMSQCRNSSWDYYYTTYGDQTISCILTPVCLCATISGSPNKSISTEFFIVQTALTSLSLMLVIYFVSKKTLFLVAILKARKYNVAKKPRVQHQDWARCYMKYVKEVSLFFSCSNKYYFCLFALP